MIARAALFAGVMFGVWSVCATIACGSECKTSAECPTDRTYLCCAGACVADDASNCGKCGAACALATTCTSGVCTGSGTSACAITFATATASSGACDLSASWKCIQGEVACHCGGSTGTCTCPSGVSVDGSFLCPSCDASLADLTKVATLCNVSPPTP